MGASKSRKDMIEGVAVKTALPERVVKSVFNAIVEYIAEHVSRGEDVHLLSLGRFWLKKAPGRSIMVPSVGKLMKVKDRYIPKFSFGRYIERIIRKEAKRNIPISRDGKNGEGVPNG